MKRQIKLAEIYLRQYDQACGECSQAVLEKNDSSYPRLKARRNMLFNLWAKAIDACLAEHEVALVREIFTA